MLDVLIVCDPADWAAIAPQEGDAAQPWHYLYANAVTGRWKPQGANEVYNVLGNQEQIEALEAALEAHTVGAVVSQDAWVQGPAVDSLEPWPTDPTRVLALMRDHVTYDQDGNPTGSIPATLENPNWGHVFFGQGNRIFAGDFSDDFSEEFL